MARIRTVKPAFFQDEELQALEKQHPGKYPMFVYEGLWCQCDKEGRFVWKPATLKLAILPFLPFDMTEALAILLESTSGDGTPFITQYEVAGKRYGLVSKFKEHQYITGKEKDAPALYPAPPKLVDKVVHRPEPPQPHAQGNQGDAAAAAPVHNPDSGKTLPGYVPDTSQAGHGTPGMDIGKSIGKGNDVKTTAPSPSGSAPAAPPVTAEDLTEKLSPVVIELPLNTGEPWPVRETMVAEWEKLFPQVDVRQSLNQMRAWCDAKTSRRKTKRGIKAFVVGWLGRNQDRGECKRAVPAPPAAPTVGTITGGLSPSMIATRLWNDLLNDLKLNMPEPTVNGGTDREALNEALEAVGGFDYLKTLKPMERNAVAPSFIRVYMQRVAKRGNNPLPSAATAAAH